MNAERKTAMATGMIFIVATLAALGARALDPSITDQDPLAEVAAHSGSMTAAILLDLLAAVTSVGIAVALYPVLRKAGRGLAIGAVVFRTIEAVFYIVAVVGLLSVLDLSQQVAALKKHDPGVREDTPDAVHQLRVAARRMRSALATFRSLTDPARAGTG